MDVAPLALMCKEPGVVVTETDHGAQRVLDFGTERKYGGYMPRSGTPPPPPSAREQKRPKKHVNPKKNACVTAEAASDVEDRQSK
jgi:hypothetical protein